MNIGDIIYVRDESLLGEYHTYEYTTHTIGSINYHPLNMDEPYEIISADTSYETILVDGDVPHWIYIFDKVSNNYYYIYYTNYYKLMTLSEYRQSKIDKLIESNF